MPRQGASPILGGLPDAGCWGPRSRPPPRPGLPRPRPPSPPPLLPFRTAPGPEPWGGTRGASRSTSAAGGGGSLPRRERGSSLPPAGPCTARPCAHDVQGAAVPVGALGLEGPREGRSPGTARPRACDASDFLAARPSEEPSCARAIRKEGGRLFLSSAFTSGAAGCEGRKGENPPRFIRFLFSGIISES